jgi:leader peptidase (prepilin peptidase)/N-methyltransferase
MIPDWLVYSLVFVFGAIIGSFLNVVIYRLHTGRSLNGSSHCLSCGIPLRWYELFPVVSYLAIRGRCRTCAAAVPARYFVVEVLTGGLFVLLWHTHWYEWLTFSLLAALISVLVVIAVYDMRHTIIPDELTILVGLLAVPLVGTASGWSFTVPDLVGQVVGGVSAAAFLFGLWYASAGRWIGFGDVKLALPLGFIVGVPEALSLIILSFWVGAVISVALLGIQRLLKRGKITLPFLGSPRTMKSEVPFAPFLISGFVLVYVYQISLFDITRLLWPFGS